MYLGIGSSRQDHSKLKPQRYINIFEVRSVNDGDFWGIEFFIPETFVRQYFENYKHLSDSMRGIFINAEIRQKPSLFMLELY